MEDSDDDNISEEGISDEIPIVHDSLSCGDDNGVEDVPETLFEEASGQKEVHSEDPFSLYSLLNKNKDGNTENDQSPKYPPGFTPDEGSKETEPNEVYVRSDYNNNVNNGNEGIMHSGHDGTNDKEGSTNNASESVRSG